MKKSRKTEKIAALRGLGSPVSALIFESFSDLLSKESIAKAHLPSADDFDDFDTFESTIYFKSILPAKVDDKSTKAMISDPLRNIMVFPPFAVSASLSASRRGTPSMDQTASAAALSFKEQCKDHPDFTEYDHKDATNSMLGFLRAHQKVFLIPLPCGFETDEQINFWFQSLRERELLPKLAPSSSGSQLGPSDDEISESVSGVTNLSTILDKYLLTDKSSKKTKFDSMSVESQGMTNNASSKSIEFSATGPTVPLDALLNYSATAKEVASSNQKSHLKGCKVTMNLHDIFHFR